MTRSARRRTVRAARVSAHVGTPHWFASARYRAFPQEAGTAMGIETIVVVVLIVLIVLFVTGYIGRGRRA